MDRRQFFAAVALGVTGAGTTTTAEASRVLVIETDRPLDTVSELLCRWAKVNPERVMAGTLTTEERCRLVDAAGELSRLPVYVRDVGPGQPA